LTIKNVDGQIGSGLRPRERGRAADPCSSAGATARTPRDTPPPPPPPRIGGTPGTCCGWQSTRRRYSRARARARERERERDRERASERERERKRDREKERESKRESKRDSKRHLARPRGASPPCLISEIAPSRCSSSKREPWLCARPPSSISESSPGLCRGRPGDASAPACLASPVPSLGLVV